MALIAIDNFTTPFKNRWHLVTIGVIALLFGIWRASGGSVDVVRTPSATEATSPAKLGTSRTTARSTPLSSPLSNRAPSMNPAEDSDSASRQNRRSFDDIERSLGLR